MEEKVLIKSRMCGAKWALLIVVYVATVAGFWAGFGADFDECIPILLAVLVGATLILELYSRCSITVTENRVYGKAVFGKRVDLPMDSISAIGTSIFWSIDVGTSSGKIRFAFINNYKDIHTTIGNLLVQRQKEKTMFAEPAMSQADELKKYKDLLDGGVISQEEFDAKKRQLLGM